ncbi:transposase [Desulfamplus magnetovallimortis]|uniref:Transposase n=2 Tax=Desulfamplus magnetovallimortis TaxID=1246637 RepID=A0A1W1HEC1_9BACT|nr:transposase [Desulfamplus magnetovallimortis]
MGYPLSMKEAVVKKVLMSNKTHYEIAKEAGIARSTLTYWLKQYTKDGEMNLINVEKSPKDWSGEERFNALVATANMSEMNRVAWCRKEGLFTHHLDQWKKDAIFLLTQKESILKSNDSKDLKREISFLKKELSRKDQALAETAALLVLKKKADLIWGDAKGD